MSDETATVSYPVRKPHDWDKVLSVALFRTTGSTMEEAANLAGVSKRTVWSWEHSEFMEEALAEVRSRWLQGAVTRARASLLAGLDEDPRLALDFLGRVDPGLNPKAALELSTPQDREFVVRHITEATVVGPDDG